MDGREPSRMSSSAPPGMMVGANLYSGNPMMIPNSDGGMSGIRLSFNPIVSSGSKPVDESSSVYHADSVPSMRQCGVLSMGEPTKKKRGRPRKYWPDGNMSLALSPSGYSNPNGSPIPNPNGGPVLEPGVKKRGRPPGSGRKQQLDALGSPGISFTPHVINVKAGEDVASKIMAFSQQGPRTVCILSANGAICNVTLRQPAISGGTVTYEGRFEIISLSGSFLLTENGGARSRTGGLSVALAGSDGRVLGGGVAGMLMAATTVQVVMGSFIAAEKKPKSELKREPSSASGFGAASASSPPSQGSSGESDDDCGPGSPAMNPSGSVGTYAHVSELAPTPVASAKSELSFSPTPPEAWGRAALPDDLRHQHQPVSMASSNHNMPSVSLASGSIFAGFQDSFSCTSRSNQSFLANPSSSSTNLQGEATSSNENSSLLPESSIVYQSTILGTKAMTSSTNLELPGQVLSTLPRRYSAFAERMGTASSSYYGMGLVTASPKSKKTGSETREELLNSLFARQDASTVTGEGSVPAINGLAPQTRWTFGQPTDQQQGTSFSLQLVQHTLEETLGTMQSAIHEDVKNLHLELLRQFHMQEMEMSNSLASVLEKQDELMKEVQSLRRENHQLRRLL